MSRGKVPNSGSGSAIGASSRGSMDKRKQSRGPGVSSLNSGNGIPKIGNNNSSVAGAGFKNNNVGSLSSKGPYMGADRGPGSSSLAKAGAGSLNTNVFNIPKYGQGGLGGGIGGGLGGMGGGGL